MSCVKFISLAPDFLILGAHEFIAVWKIARV